MHAPLSNCQGRRRIMLEVIPKVYDTDRAVRIVGPDEKQRVVMVNIPWRDEQGKDRHVTELSRQIDTKAVETASKERIVELQEANKLQIAEMKTMMAARRRR